MPAHRIRLGGPWEVRPHAGAPAGRMTMPGTLRDGGWAGFAGRVSFYRRFGRPSNLSADETVWLDFEAVVGRAELWLNGERLGDLDKDLAFDVSARLNDRNRLEIILDAADDSYGIVGEVRLEIRTAN